MSETAGIMPCMICNVGANAEFNRWEIVVEGTIEMLCAVYVCKNCDAPTWVQAGIRDASDDCFECDDEPQTDDVDDFLFWLAKHWENPASPDHDL